MISPQDFVFTAKEMGKAKSLEGCHISNSFTLTHNYPAEPVTSHFSDSWKRKYVHMCKTLGNASSVGDSGRACLVYPWVSSSTGYFFLFIYKRITVPGLLIFLVFLDPWVDTKHLQSIRLTVFQCCLDLQALPSAQFLHCMQLFQTNSEQDCWRTALETPAISSVC